MDLALAQYSTSSSYSILTFLLIIFLLSLRWISKIHSRRNTLEKKPAPPEPTGAWPLIGHLLLLRKPQPVHITLGDMADECGPLFTINLGVRRILVVSRSDVAKECLTSYDKVFANRPKSSLALEILGYDFAMLGFSHYGPYWRQVRKIVTTKLLSNNRLERLKHIRESEVNSAVKEVHDLWLSNNRSEVLVDMTRWLFNINVNVILRMLVGKPLVVRGHELSSSRLAVETAESDWCQKAMRDFLHLAGEIPVAEALPFLRFLDLDGKEKAMKRTAKVLDDLAQAWLDEHKQIRSSFGDDPQVEKDFLSTMLSVLDSYEEIHSTYGSDKTIRATCLSLTLGATDTTTITLTWALTLLLNNREVLKKAQTELDLNVGRERQVKESDFKNLPYLQSIIKETLRLYPAAPLLIPHESMEDCTVGGYHIPAGTRLFINVSKIQRDPQVWPDPDKFLPERFLTTAKNCDVRDQNFEFIPFGSGRRMCPGVTLALQLMPLTLANLLHGFDIATPSNDPLDLNESSGLTNLRANNLEVLLIPRLSDELYHE